MKTINLIGSAALVAGLLAASSAQAQITLTFNENGPYTGSPYGVPSGSTGTIQYIASAADYAGGSGGSTTVVLGADKGDTEPNGGNAATLDYLIPGMANATWFEYGWVVVYAPGTSTPGANDANIVDLIHFDNSSAGPSYTYGTGVTINGVKSSTTYDEMFYYSKEGSGNQANYWVSSSTLSLILAAANTAYVMENADGSILYDPANSSSPGYNLNNPNNGFGNNGAWSAATTQYDFDFQSVVVPEASTIIAGVLLVLPFGASTLRILRRNRMA